MARPYRSAMTRLKHMDSCWPQPTTQSSPVRLHGIDLYQWHHHATVNPGYFSNTTCGRRVRRLSTKSDLNAITTQPSRPHVVTLGADDVQFVAIVEACIENAYQYYLNVADLECVARTRALR